MTKADILELPREQPEDLDIDKFIYTLHVRRKIERALEEADKDEDMSHEEFVRLSDEWLA